MNIDMKELFTADQIVAIMDVFEQNKRQAIIDANNEIGRIRRDNQSVGDMLVQLERILEAQSPKAYKAYLDMKSGGIYSPDRDKKYKKLLRRIK